MSKQLDKKRIEVEIKKVEAGKIEQELRIEERLDEIERIKASVIVSDKRIDELKKLLISMEG